MEVTEFYNKWKSIDLIKLQINSISDDTMIEATQNSLEDGVRPDGQDMPEYSPNTYAFKRASGGFISPSGRIALKDTGAFYDSMKVEKKDTFAELTINSDPNNLIDSYGDEILDTPEDEKQPILDDSRDNYIKNIKNFLGL